MTKLSWVRATTSSSGTRGDGSDIVEGQDGTDTLQFNGANIAEKIDLSANGSRLRFTRDVANITMDVDGTEIVNFAALGGADTITVNDLTGTSVTTVNLNLAGAPNVGDGAADTVIVNGTAGDDHIVVAAPANTVDVTGLSSVIHIRNAEGALDSLRINSLGGADTIDASTLPSGKIKLTEDGGDGDDILKGSKGDDLVIGGRGNDVALMGEGNDTFVWNPGDGSDLVEGQLGVDTLQFNGANINEKFDLSANGSRLRFTRDIANIVMDVNGTEIVNVVARGGVDTITVGDLSGTAVTEVNLDLSNGAGAGDGSADTVTVTGTAGADVISVAGDANGVSVNGLHARVNITGSEAANDRLVVEAGDGDDVVEASALAAGAIQLTANGGKGDDVLIGSQGNDALNGGVGDDVLIGGLGLDVLDGGPGNNIVIQ